MTEPAKVKPYAEQTAQERLAALDKLQNVLLHADWREIYLRLVDDAEGMQCLMDDACDWESFVAARAVKTYLRERLLNLRDLVESEKAQLEAEMATEGAILPPPDYEID